MWIMCYRFAVATIPPHRRELREMPIRGVRLARGLSLRETARRAELDPSHLMRAERGEAGLSIESMERLARALGLDDLARLLHPHTRKEVNRD